MNPAIKKVSDQSFESDVINSSTPVLVDYWAEWCAPCRMIAPVLDEWADEYAGRLNIAKLNIDENPNTPAKYRVMGIPTLLVFKDGELADTLVGLRPKEEIASALDRQL